MPEVRFTPKAEEDLRHVWRSIAIHDEAAADRLLLRILDKIDLLIDQPLIGPPRPNLGPEVRILVEGNCVVIYEPAPAVVVVAAVVHSMRDPENWLR